MFSNRALIARTHLLQQSISCDLALIEARKATLKADIKRRASSNEALGMSFMAGLFVGWQHESEDGSQSKHRTLSSVTKVYYPLALLLKYFT